MEIKHTGNLLCIISDAQQAKNGKLNYNLWPCDHKTSLKSLGYIFSNSQKYILWLKMIDFYFMPKVIRILSKDHVPWRYFVNFLP